MSYNSQVAFPSFAVGVHLFLPAADRPKTLMLEYGGDSQLSKDLPLQKPRWRRPLCSLEFPLGVLSLKREDRYRQEF